MLKSPGRLCSASCRTARQRDAGFGVRLAFGDRSPLRNGCAGGMSHLLAGTAMAGTWHGTHQPLSQRLPSPPGAERSELPPLLLGEVGAEPLLRGEGGQGMRGGGARGAAPTHPCLTSQSCGGSCCRRALARSRILSAAETGCGERLPGHSGTLGCCMEEGNTSRFLGGLSCVAQGC